MARRRRPDVDVVDGPDPSPYLALKNLWNDPGSGRFIRKGQSTAKARAFAERAARSVALREALRAGDGDVELLDDVLARAGVPRGSVARARAGDDAHAVVEVAERRYEVPLDSLTIHRVDASGDSERRVWERDFTKFAEALEPYVIEIDGDTYLSPEAPEELTRPYEGLLAMGYARGYFNVDRLDASDYQGSHRPSYPDGDPDAEPKIDRTDTLFDMEPVDAPESPPADPAELLPQAASPYGSALDRALFSQGLGQRGFPATPTSLGEVWHHARANNRGPIHRWVSDRVEHHLYGNRVERERRVDHYTDLILDVAAGRPIDVNGEWIRPDGTIDPGATIAHLPDDEARLVELRDYIQEGGASSPDIDRVVRAIDDKIATLNRPDPWERFDDGSIRVDTSLEAIRVLDDEDVLREMRTDLTATTLGSDTVKRLLSAIDARLRDIESYPHSADRVRADRLRRTMAAPRAEDWDDPTTRARALSQLAAILDTDPNLPFSTPRHMIDGFNDLPFTDDGWERHKLIDADIDLLRRGREMHRTNGVYGDTIASVEAAGVVGLRQQIEQTFDFPGNGLPPGYQLRMDSRDEARQRLGSQVSDAVERSPVMRQISELVGSPVVTTATVRHVSDPSVDDDHGLGGFYIAAGRPGSVFGGALLTVVNTDGQGAGYKGLRSGAVDDLFRPDRITLDATVEGTIRHEFGHYIDRLYEQTLGGDHRRRRNELIDAFDHDARTTISPYAATTPSELIAEVWTLISHPDYGRWKRTQRDAAFVRRLNTAERYFNPAGAWMFPWADDVDLGDTPYHWTTRDPEAAVPSSPVDVLVDDLFGGPPATPTGGAP